MRPLKQDLSVFNEFKFEKPPVGVKFLLGEPKGIEQIDKILPFCEMIKEAHQRGAAFYFSKENENYVGRTVLGMEELPPFVEGGQIGSRFGIYQEPRANHKIYQYVPKLRRALSTTSLSPHWTH